MKYEWKQEKGDGRGPRAQAAGWRPQRDLPGMVRSSALASGVWAAARMGQGGGGVGTEQACDTLQRTKLSSKPASGPPFPIQGEMIHVSTAVM